MGPEAHMSKSFFKIVQKKRKEQHISQEKLAEILNVSTVKRFLIALCCGFRQLPDFIFYFRKILV